MCRTRIQSRISYLVPPPFSEALERDSQARCLAVLVKCGIWAFFGAQTMNLESDFRFGAPPFSEA